MNGLALCAGGGGLEIGISLLLGDGNGSLDDHRTVCYVEGEAYAASVLVSKMEEGRLHPAPIWSDLRTFNGSVWRGKVDLISAGFPCQPFSVAGSNLGTEDPRHLWPHVARIISEVRPSVIILENVPGVLVHAGAIVAGDLAEMGYDSSWGLVRAADAGAHHRRERWFCTAIITNPDGSSCENGQSRRGSTGFSQEGGGIPIKDGRNDRDEPGGCGQALPDTDSKRSGLGSSEKKERWKVARRFIDQARVYRTGFEQSWSPEPSMGRMADGVADWMDRLRLLGNGVVPQQAALAIALTCEAFEMEMNS